MFSQSISGATLISFRIFVQKVWLATPHSQSVVAYHFELVFSLLRCSAPLKRISETQLLLRMMVLCLHRLILSSSCESAATWRGSPWRNIHPLTAGCQQADAYFEPPQPNLYTVACSKSSPAFSFSELRCLQYTIKSNDRSLHS